MTKGILALVLLCSMSIAAAHAQIPSFGIDGLAACRSVPASAWFEQPVYLIDQHAATNDDNFGHWQDSCTARVDYTVEEGGVSYDAWIDCYGWQDSIISSTEFSGTMTAESRFYVAAGCPVAVEGWGEVVPHYQVEFDLAVPTTVALDALDGISAAVTYRGSGDTVLYQWGDVEQGPVVYHLQPGNYSFEAYLVNVVSDGGPTYEAPWGSWSFTIVPEPTSLSLLCLGCLALGSRYRRQVRGTRS